MRCLDQQTTLNSKMAHLSLNFALFQVYYIKPLSIGNRKTGNENFSHYISYAGTISTNAYVHKIAAYALPTQYIHTSSSETCNLFMQTPRVLAINQHVLLIHVAFTCFVRKLRLLDLIIQCLRCGTRDSHKNPNKYVPANKAIFLLCNLVYETMKSICGFIVLYIF